MSVVVDVVDWWVDGMAWSVMKEGGTRRTHSALREVGGTCGLD